MADEALRTSLKILLETLEEIGSEHEELYDTDVREQMFEAVHRSFIVPQGSYTFPHDFGMHNADANEHVRVALMEYVRAANGRANALGMADPAERLSSFQDSEVCTAGEEQYPDDFFGWAEAP